MRSTALALGLVVVTAAACGGTSDDVPNDPGGATSDLTSSDLEAKLTCDSGAAVLEQDKRVTKALDAATGKDVELRGLQFVVHDRKIVDFLSSKVDHIQNAQHEVILNGSMPANASFDFFEDRSFASANVRPEGNKVRVSDQIIGVVHRVKTEPDKVRIVFNKTTERTTCSTFFENDVCSFDRVKNQRGETKTDRTDAPIADWVFRCKAP
jgi:hypothetical protein